MSRNLIERLRAKRQVYNGRNTFRDEIINPDGPEAADLIERLTSAPAGEDVIERAQIVDWLLDQSDKGADIGIGSPKGSTRRAAFGGGSLALKRAADEIASGAHLLSTAPSPSPEGEAR